MYVVSEQKKPAVFIATDITSRNMVPEILHHSRAIDNVVTKDVQCQAVNNKPCKYFIGICCLIYNF